MNYKTVKECNTLGFSCLIGRISMGSPLGLESILIPWHVGYVCIEKLLPQSYWL